MRTHRARACIVGGRQAEQDSAGGGGGAAAAAAAARAISPSQPASDRTAPSSCPAGSARAAARPARPAASHTGAAAVLACTNRSTSPLPARPDAGSASSARAVASRCCKAFVGALHWTGCAMTMQGERREVEQDRGGDQCAAHRARCTIGAPSVSLQLRETHTFTSLPSCAASPRSIQHYKRKLYNVHEQLCKQHETAAPAPEVCCVRGYNRARRAPASSSLAIVSRCTTSGPSARRSVRAPAHMWARGVTSDTPAPPCTCARAAGRARRLRVCSALAPCGRWLQWRLRPAAVAAPSPGSGPRFK